MTQAELAAALQKRQRTKKNLNRYMHTRSFNQLAGKCTAPGSDLTVSHAFARCMVGLFALAVLLVGLYFAFF